MGDQTTIPPRSEQRVEITKHIRVLWGAEVTLNGEPSWTGWGVWDDYAEECAVYRTREQAIHFAKQLATEYAVDDERERARAKELEDEI
jgi:hypothetical protein